MQWDNEKKELRWNVNELVVRLKGGPDINLLHLRKLQGSFSSFEALQSEFLSEPIYPDPYWKDLHEIIHNKFGKALDG